MPPPSLYSTDNWALGSNMTHVPDCEISALFVTPPHLERFNSWVLVVCHGSKEVERPVSPQTWNLSLTWALPELHIQSVGNGTTLLLLDNERNISWCYGWLHTDLNNFSSVGCLIWSPGLVHKYPCICLWSVIVYNYGHNSVLAGM